MSNYTSEDNQSFQEIIETADRKLRQKFAILYEAEDVQEKRMAMALELPGIEEQFEAIEGPKNVSNILKLFPLSNNNLNFCLFSFFLG